MKRLLPLAALAMIGCGSGGPATKVTVLITFVDDAPYITRAIAAATVTVHAGGLGGLVATLKTDDQGRAEVDLTPGTYTFCFVNGSGRNACKALAVPSAESVLVAYADGFVQDWSLAVQKDR